MTLFTKSDLKTIAEKHRKKHKSLRTYFGIPMSTALFMSPGLNAYSGDAGDGGYSDGIDEMIQVAKNLQNQMKKSGKPFLVYDVESSDDAIVAEAGVGSSGAQFEVDTTPLQVQENVLEGPKKYKVHVQNPEDKKMIIIDYTDPDLKIKKTRPTSNFKKVTDKDEEGQGTNFRKWSSKYWQNKPIKEMISEIIDPNEIDVKTLKFNDELCPLLWNGLELDQEVRDALLKNAIEFIKSCKIEGYKYKDIVLVGSMANYTYTPQSDVDIHIVLDFGQFKADEDFLGEYFDAKKDLWSNMHQIKIKDHDVECYIQNSQEPYTSIGVYSLMKNEWVREPIKKMVSVDEGNIQLKAAHFMNAIDKLETKFKNGEDIVSAVTKLKTKIKTMRKNGLYKEGEYSTENLVFKVLRNSGYLEKLINLKNNNMDQNLSI